VIEAAGWRVTHVTTRPGDSWYSIVNKDDRHQYGTPAELARQVTKQQRQETNMSGTNSDTGSPGFGAKTGSTPSGGDSRSPLAKRGGTDVQSGGSNPDNSTVKK
jgi:hypothetical protein